MAKEEIYSAEITEVSKGVYLDCDPINQPKGTRRFSLNTIEQTIDGKTNISNELSNYNCSNFTNGFYPIGDRYIGDNTSVVISTNTLGLDEIGLLNKDDIYTTLVSTGVLGLKITNQCDIIYRLRRGKERVIYWVDALSKARTFNLDRLHNFYNTAYQTYLQNGGDPNIYIGEKWDIASFDLVKSYKKVPTFNKAQIIETGDILPGSYNFAIQLVDEDLNPTAWITTSNTVNIYNDTVSSSYERIRGSRNVTSASQSWGRASKSIKLTIGNLDDSFPFYRVAIIRAAGNTGEPEKVLISQLFSTSDSIFLYSGNDSALREGSLTDILVDTEIIFAPKHIEQLENRLILANGKGKSINYCDFQMFASKIKSDLTTKAVVLNNEASDPNVKNSNSTFILGGYMPGEVASFGISYLFDDGFVSPVFHIPGKNILDTTSLMKYYEIDDKYLDIHNCSTDNYWGFDSMHKTLVGKNIRHHRFPFRKEVSKPLVTTTTATTNITRYRLKLVITLNPAWTPGPIAYPLDVNSVPVLIGYKFSYLPTGSGTGASFSGALTDTIVANSTEIVLYDDSSPLSFVTGSVYFQLDGSSALAAYQGGGNDRFIITGTYDSYVLSSTINADISEIFGITFSNIEKPRPDIVGFYIVRNERTEEDKLIIDNAILGPTTEFQQYISFGLINPKQYYTASNCGITESSGKTLVYNNKTLWFYNPEYEYYNKKTEFDSIEVEGKYTEVSVNMPTISDVGGSDCNGGLGGTKGIYIQDVQAGTSYNPALNQKKNKDDDGFDLIIGYRNTNEGYASNNTLVLPPIENTFYLNAASYKNYNTKTYYNVSVDNKIGLIATTAAFDTNELYNTTDHKNSLIYASLVKNNTSAYSNFMNRPYYKEHNNAVLFGDLNVVNDFEVFNGDADISAMNFVSSVFYDIVVGNRPKKNKLWSIIVGAVLIAAAIALSIPSLGASLAIGVAAVTALTGLAISYGVSLIMSGIKFDQFKAMIDTDYSKGLQDTVTDGGVFETVRNSIDGKDHDDTIRWFADRASNIYIESSVPFGLRSGLTCGVPDFVNAPAPYNELEFRSYLTEKLTTVDRDQGSGRLYRGFASAEIYDMNLDYLRFNKQKRFTHLPIEYDCCSDFNEIFPLRRWYSQQSFQEEKIDNYRAFLPNNYSDMEGEHGEITGLYRLGNNLFIHTVESLWQQPANLQERITDEIVSFIGTGEFLAIPPRKVIDDALGSAGTQHKWATIKTKNGVFSVSELENSIYIHGEKINYPNKGMYNYFKNNLKSSLSKQLYNELGVVFPNDNNPANPNGIGYISIYDTRFERVVFTKRDYLVLPDKLTDLYAISSIPLTGNDFNYCTVNGRFYQGVTALDLSNTDYFENKSFTISYSFHTQAWTGWHSYLPTYYIRSKNSMYSCFASNLIYKHNLEGSYGIFYGVEYPFIIERVGLSNPLIDKITEDLTIQTNARQWDATRKQYINRRYITFNKILLYNNSQCSGETSMVVKETQANPQDWYQQQVVNISGSLLISRAGENWNINRFRDFILDYDKAIFSSDWDDIKSDYFIDKIVNVQAIDFNKNWYELRSFKDKFIVVRLIFDNFHDVNLSLNYSIDTEQISK